MHPPSKQYVTIALCVALSWPWFANAGSISSGHLQNSSTSSNPTLTTIQATPQAMIRFELASMKLSNIGNQLLISIVVDSSSSSVISGIDADQTFQDEMVGAAYFGYYLSTGVRSVHQTDNNVHIKLRKGTNSTQDRTYYLLGNGTVTPTQQSDLDIAPSSFTTFATAPSNSIHCGPNYASNGLSGSQINCSGGSTVAEMDLTQFVKVYYGDPEGSIITSQLEFIAEVE